jgi:hypothetical protein
MVATVKNTSKKLFHAGIILFIIGVAGNYLAFSLNGWMMPIDYRMVTALDEKGEVWRYTDWQPFGGYQPISDDTRVRLLCDIIPMPGWSDLSYISAGDIFIVLGLSIFGPAFLFYTILAAGHSLRTKRRGVRIERTPATAALPAD